MDHPSQDWQELLNLTTAWGEASRRNDTSLPSDDDLWAYARSHRLELPAPVNDLLVDDLRDVFNAGRLPHLIDLDAVVAHLAEQGRPALVAHSGGNTATLYTGSRYTDRLGDTRWSVTAGPGWFDAPGHRRPVADTSEFTIGPDDQDNWWCLRVPEHTTTAAVSALIITTIDEVEARRARLSAAASAAAGAMVRVVAARYPELGTAMPDPGRDLVRDVGDLITDWLHARLPALRAAPPTITDRPRGQEGRRS
ncbi:hypothetical protein KBX50_28015 [Micromonospora sp. C51]|uniref:hypothetical protein n=1 Tax=Micromonospora sp. C51 TaxID=2824879 RepID=UPI001B39107D|nr:hypothetical protein [Micromonospora sp. C51]MBQ1052288.1 hypothetical protein [Micromonospora sp. C51]